MKALIAVIFLFTLTFQYAQAQNLYVENPNTGKEVRVWKGTKVCYKERDSDLRKGRFMGCYDSFVYTKKDTFNINDLSVFGIKNQNRMLLEIGARVTYYSSIALFGLGVVVYASFRAEPGVGLFIMFFAKVPMELAKYYIQKDKYLMYNLEEEWQLKVTQ